MSLENRNSTSCEDMDLRLQQLKSGNEHAFSIVFNAIKNKLSHKAYETLFNASEVDDVVQQVQIRMWQQRAKLPATWREMLMYVLEMTSNAARDINRLARSKRNVVLDDASELQTLAPEFAQREELEILVERLRDRLLSELPRRRRKVLAAVAERLSYPHRSMRDVYQDVGLSLGLNWGSVRNEWSHTVRTLDEMFPQPFSDDDSRALLQLIGASGETTKPEFA